MDADDFMDQALAQARAAGARGEVPVGAVMVVSATGRVIAADGNRTEERGDPTAHAEMLVVSTAAQAQGTPRLPDCDLYVTLEPCTMCAGALSLARVRRLYFGAYDPKMGGVEHGSRVFEQPTCHHAPEVVGGVRETEAAELLREFFRERR